MIISQSIGLELPSSKMENFSWKNAKLVGGGFFHLKKKTAARNISSFEGGLFY